MTASRVSRLFQIQKQTFSIAHSTSAMAASTQTNGVDKATPHQISLSFPGIYHHSRDSLPSDTTALASALLQQNHVKHHVYFNNGGFHNHIPHHLLTAFAVGATAPQIQHAYDRNASYQRPQYPVQDAVVEDMRKDKRNLLKYCNDNEKKVFGGTEKYYADFQEFFATEMVRLGGVGPVMNEYVFKRDEVAEGILTRLFAGFVHPLIHVGFGLEFHQPAVVAEALSQACVHDNWIAQYLHTCEKAASSKLRESRTLLQLLNEARANEKVRNSPMFSDGNKLRDGVLGRAFDETVAVASQWTVKPTREDIARKTAEMINFTAYFAGAAAFPSWSEKLKNKQPRVDFFLMHSLNASVFFSSFAEDSAHQDWFKLEDKARLLQMKGWTDLGMYISRGSPALDVNDILAYEPKSKKRGDEGWSEIFNRVANYSEDDGHAVKLVRALANGQRACQAYEGEEWCVIKGEMWEKLGHLVVDGIDSGGPLYVRSAGFEEAWENMPDQKHVDGKL